jgi:hypothetical protein
MVIGGQHCRSGARNYVLLQSCKVLIHSAEPNFVQAGNGVWMKLSGNGSWRPPLPSPAGNFALLRSCKILISQCRSCFFTGRICHEMVPAQSGMAAMGTYQIRRCTSMFNNRMKKRKNRGRPDEQLSNARKSTRRYKKRTKKTME